MGFLVFIIVLLSVVRSSARSYLDDYLETYREILMGFEEDEHLALGKAFDRSKHELIVKLDSLKKLLNCQIFYPLLWMLITTTKPASF